MARKNVCLTQLETNLPRFQGARPKHVRGERSVNLFPKGVAAVTELLFFLR